jgi:succinate-semialdehyde dehydrogenase/glutarate-semialdehyde dehydrogenase
VEKCAWVCTYYADNAASFLEDEKIDTDASTSFVAFQPLGVVLAVMPWNFPFWQVFRFVAPGLMAGNGAVLKHASNVPGSALAIEEVLRSAGFPEHLFRTLLIPSGKVDAIIHNEHVRAVTLTGSEPAGSAVAATAGKLIKKSVLELGGSDPFIVLEDADIPACVQTSVKSRLINTGQSCIAAKRFIVVRSIAEEFQEQHMAAMKKLKLGDPLDEDTDIGPLAREDLVDDIEKQVSASVAMGAEVLMGGERADRPGAYYLPTILTKVGRGMPAYDEETFGPVSAIIEVEDAQEAINVANDSRFGLGGAVWSRDVDKAVSVARQVTTGGMFINGHTKSDPRLPFGGVKKSGYGRELSHYGIKEFVNKKTIWIA